MKAFCSIPRLGSIWSRLAGAALTLASLQVRADDAIAHPAHFRGEIRFGNSNPTILSRLNETLGRSIYFYGNSVAPAPAHHVEASRVLDHPFPFDYEVAVEGAVSPTGYSYGLSCLILAAQQYAPLSVVSSPIRQGESQIVNFHDCPGILNIRFVDRPGGSPVSVSGASYFVSGPDPAQHAVVYNVPGTGYKLIARSGTALQLQVSYTTGTNPMLDRLSHYVSRTINSPLKCDEERDVEIVVPAPTSLGNLTGRLEIVGERPVVHGGPNYGMNTVVIADSPPYEDDISRADRYAFLDRTPSSGNFSLPNLIPSEGLPGAAGAGAYRVWSRVQMDSGRRLNFFRTPSGFLNLASGTSDLGNLFVISPGYVEGRVKLRGPAGIRSALAHLSRVSDTADAAGNPAGGGWQLPFHSSIEAVGVNERAPGARQSAYQGEGYTEFGGDLDIASGELAGSYRLILGGLNSDPSVWNVARLNLAFDTEGSPDPYLKGNLRITDQAAGSVLVQSGAHVRRDFDCCFGAYEVKFHAPVDAAFFQPAIRVLGQYQEISPAGERVAYTVENAPGTALGTAVPVPFLGEPRKQSDAASDGVVRMFLPSGTYTFYPTMKMVSRDGIVSDFSLPAISNVVVQCGAVQMSDQDLRIDIPILRSCLRRPYTRIEGSIHGVTNVTRILWERGDNAQHLICENCGINPEFAFDLPVNDICTDQTFTLRAYDAAGHSATFTGTVFADRMAPQITAPSSIVRQCTGPDGARVDYAVGASDECALAALECTPPSGSLFPIGTTTVECLARDGCGNETRQTFTVTVTGDCGAGCLQLACPTNIVLKTCGAKAAMGHFSIQATNHCNPSDLHVVATPASGSLFPVGTTTIHVIATGGRQTNHCQFDVIVVKDPQCNDIPPCTTNLLANGSFEQPGIPDGFVALAPGSAELPGWTPVLTGVTWRNPVVAPGSGSTGSAAAGNYLLSLATKGGLGGGVRQSFPTVPGKTYRCDFALGTSREKGRRGYASLTVTVAGTAYAFNIFNASASTVWEQKHISFTAQDALTTLTFASLDDAETSFVNIDDVRVGDCCGNADLKITPSVTVEWSCGVLQSAADPSGPYTDVPGAVSPRVEAAGPARKFWKIRP